MELAENTTDTSYVPDAIEEIEEIQKKYLGGIYEAALDDEVARLEGLIPANKQYGNQGLGFYPSNDSIEVLSLMIDSPFQETAMRRSDFRPTMDWAIAGPIIEKNNITLIHNPCGWSAKIWDKTDVSFCQAGGLDGFFDSPLVAAMACYVQLNKKLDKKNEA